MSASPLLASPELLLWEDPWKWILQLQGSRKPESQSNNIGDRSDALPERRPLRLPKPGEEHDMIPIVRLWPLSATARTVLRAVTATLGTGSKTSLKYQLPGPAAKERYQPIPTSRSSKRVRGGNSSLHLSTHSTSKRHAQATLDLELHALG